MQDLTSVEIGTRLRELRLAKQLTQSQLAGKAGVGLRTILRIEQGEGTRVETLSAIAAALETPMSDLTDAPADHDAPADDSVTGLAS